LGDAVRALGDAAGDPQAASRLLARAGLDGVPDAAALRGDDDLFVRLLDGLDALARGIDEAPEAPRGPATAAPPPVAPLFEAGLTDAGGDAARLLGDVVGALAGRSFVLVQAGTALELRLQGPADARPLGWPSLPLEARERLALALRLRRDDEALARSGAQARFVILGALPASLGRDGALAEFLAMVAPNVAQVVVPDEARREPGPPPSPARDPGTRPARATPA
jgi:hypothetical protein